MNRAKYLLIILLIILFLIVLTIISFIYFGITKPPSVKPNTYLELKLAGAIDEISPPDFVTAKILGYTPLTMNGIWNNIRKAKVDRRIKGILLRIGYLNCGWGKVNEIREALLDFKKSGKKVISYIEEGADFDKEYYLATASNKIYLHPLGLIVINGLGGYFTFYKKALDKLGIKAEFEHIEEYKTAADIFTEEGFTEANREMTEAILDDHFSLYLETISRARNKTKEEMMKLINYGFFQGKKALEAGLVDGLLFEDELRDKLKGKQKNLSLINYSQYLKIKPSSVGLETGRKIALIYATGPIKTGEGAYRVIGASTIARWIRKARKDSSIKAIVFRVDSPGGSAIGSDIIWREVILAKKEKPFIVSMSDVAASGGYWISMAANEIFAHPQTLTGSIGVLFGKFDFSGFYKKIGITAEKLIRGEKADIWSTFRGFTPQERKMIREEIWTIYDEFLTKIAHVRKMTKERVNEIGRGRVWTGNQAFKLGLIDHLGGLNDAIERAKELARIPREEKVRLVVWPKKISLFEVLFGRRNSLSKINFYLDEESQKLINYIFPFRENNFWAIMLYPIEIK
jgi:protease-4